MEKKENLSGPAVKLVRQYIIRFCMEQGDTSVKLPSTSSYAKYFGYSIRTIAMVFASLVKDGWIIGKKGVGYYTVPYKRAICVNAKKTIGMFLGDSQILSYDYNQWSFFAQAGIAVSAQKMRVTIPVFYGNDSRTISKELEAMKLDGIFCVNVSNAFYDVLLHFSKKKHAVVTMGNKIGNLPVIKMDWYNCGSRLGELANQYRFAPDEPVVWCHAYDPINAEIYRGFLDSFQAANPQVLLESPMEVLQYLTKLLRQGKKAAVIFAFAIMLNNILELYENENRNIYSETLLIGDNWVAKNVPDYQGLVFGYPHEELGRTVAAMLQKQFAGESVQDVLLKLDVHELK